MGNDLAAEAYFRRGEIYYALSRKVKLKLPLKKMRAHLKTKVRFFKQAQRSFRRIKRSRGILGHRCGDETGRAVRTILS